MIPGQFLVTIIRKRAEFQCLAGSRLESGVAIIPTEGLCREHSENTEQRDLDCGPRAMRTLLIGFDSAWTCANSGALAGLLHCGDGEFRELGPPLAVDYPCAEDVIRSWQAKLAPAATMVLLDQPTIVENAAGQRPVENIVGSVVSRRCGGMQPANTSKKGMFDSSAPVWRFLARFGGPANPLVPVTNTMVIETYPVLAMIALGWTLPDR